MAVKNLNPLLQEGSKWKEMARAGKLSQSDFNRLRGSSVGSKYLNPRNVIRNKERGQKAEMKKLGINPTYIRHNDADITRSVTTLDQGIPTIHMGTKNVSPLMYRLFKAHETDEAIQGSKFMTNPSKKFNKSFIRSINDKQNFDRVSNLEKKARKSLGKAYSTKDLANLPEADRLNLLNHAVGANKDHMDYVGYGHMPGVLKREFELRNLLYPSYRGRVKEKGRKSFSSGKFDVTGVSRTQPEISYGIRDNKKDQINRTIKRMGAASYPQRELINKMIKDLEDNQL